jgi:hypothetical protein
VSITSTLYSKHGSHNQPLLNIVTVIKLKRMRLAGHTASTGEMTNENILAKKKSLKGRERGRPRDRLEDNIRIVLREIGWEFVDWMHLAQDRDHWQGIVNTIMNPSVFMKDG